MTETALPSTAIIPTSTVGPVGYGRRLPVIIA